MKMVIGALVAAPLLAAPAMAATASQVLEAKLTAMRVVFACSPDPERGMYRAAREAARRFALQHNDVLSDGVRQVAELHRGLRDGKVSPPEVNQAKCSVLMDDAMDDAKLLESQL